MSYPLFLVLKILASTTFALSMYPQTLVGRLSLGQAGTLMLASYVFALTRSPLLTALVLGVVGAVVSFCGNNLAPSQFSALNLALGEAVRISFSNCQAVGGASGLTLSHRPVWLVPVLFVVTFVFCLSLSKSKTALVFKATRDDSLAMGVLGFKTPIVKAVAHSMSFVLCAFSAVGYSSLTGFISPADFVLMRSYEALCLAVLGGGVWGITLFSFALEIFSMLTQSFSSAKMLLYGVLLILVSVKGWENVKSFKPFKVLRQRSGAQKRVV